MIAEPSVQADAPVSAAAFPPAGRSLRLAYLTTVYPAVSHTFIRRELREMERRGHLVLRLAIRPPAETLADPVDREEFARTVHCLALPLRRHLLALFLAFVRRPLRFADALRLAWTMGLRSDRGVGKHLLYLLEACSFLVVLQRHEIAHVHVHFGTNSATVARLIRRLGGPPFSFTVHGPTEFDAAIGFDLRGKIGDAAFVVAITDYCAAQLRRWAQPADWPKIQLVRCTVGDDFFSATEPLDQESRQFCCVGRLTAQKGQLTLIDAFARLVAAGHDARLVFVGDGELRAEVEARIAARGLAARVGVTGYVSEAEVRRHIAASRAMVLPSYAEGLPMVIMEAFAVGRPVISTYVAGIPELVRPGENGWLVPAGNVEELCAALAEALTTSTDRLAQMAARGREMTYLLHRTRTEGDRLEEILQRFVIPNQGGEG